MGSPSHNKPTNFLAFINKKLMNEYLLIPKFSCKTKIKDMSSFWKQPIFFFKTTTYWFEKKICNA